MKFIFDLDGTLTSKETLPIIANHFCINDKISELTKQTIAGNIPFVESFIQDQSINLTSKKLVKYYDCYNLGENQNISNPSDIFSKFRKKWQCSVPIGKKDNIFAQLGVKSKTDIYIFKKISYIIINNTK